MERIIISAMLALSAVLLGCGQTYEDCVLDNMEKAQTPQSALFMRKACEDKYRKTSEVDEFLKNSTDQKFDITTTKSTQIDFDAIQEKAEREHFAAIYKAHPNASDLMESQHFKNWAATPQRQYVLDNGTTKQVIQLFDDYMEFKNTPVVTLSYPQDSNDNTACRYKPVMTNADYHACGLTPPGTSSN